MDNAARALIMSATVFLALLMLSIFVYAFNIGANLDATYDLRLSERQLELFNSRFELYDKNDNSIMDLLSVANAAYDVNEDFMYDAAKAIKVIIKVGSKEFVIPREEVEGFKRNKVMNGDKVISIYDLVDKKLGGENGLDVSLDNQEDDDRLTTSRLVKEIYYTAEEEPVGVSNPDATIRRQNVTVYKYLFACKCVCGKHTTGITYHNTLGRVVQVEFEAFYNDLWEYSPSVDTP